ncbi:MAG: hypothetical protein A2487_20015 [Candidatus Raymondbacteria bacterium RifOxyC12_full_50_8]|uniref:DUF1456 domain-containing protein n=1 Tax=Candidatus Raymondbacteria bacterium RIFOXYD12_FULL_49_13 TaxID=1817890 RepID=A0A1F7F372_UNCRA|nr:MAG: hypothetical protein A2248_10040 [Candidatus Raymondbacteria bacterium RIFOXYA2_FULL_49_16]OGJ86191.1 MAG: hypothetical protein A2350_18760 [Candidatus Raymondbacteria bacterium RifOxyB12_full_50_8]OGK01099.1 MAG: hypothetical protein A2519_20290 [Candidatus Raymondbacteria bacterium RIFOXYD12_FULL_49_13]OGK02175.1 MAG: hypothetical protein A2487_20015 [Candidatus Raymondbacteria bacterium RifOxyC12_full_50_8]OGP39309.1 MAG: hypothetical protein A2324_02420 [Candidatus Raymondbacteria b
MTNNDVLRRVRYALDLSDATVVNIFALAGHTMQLQFLINFLKKEDEPGYLECSDRVLEYFLDGLILKRRGPRDPKAPKPVPMKGPLSNNAKLKKLRIALELKENELLAIMKLADMPVSSPELTALFRKEGHKNYKPCGNQFLRNFLKGLTIRLRGPQPTTAA